MSKSVAESAQSFTIGTVVGGQYRIDSVLGVGGMGAVYKAHDLRLRRFVALKAIKPELLEKPERRAIVLARFEHEAVLAANLAHPNIVAVHNYGEESGVLYYVMEYIDESRSLASVVDEATGKGAFVPLDDLRTYMLHASAGLRAIHDHEAIH